MTIIDALPEYRDKDYIRKHSSVISATYVKDAGFRPEDISLFNYLLLRTRNITRPNGIYQIPMKDVVEFVRITRKGVHESLDRLCKGQIEVDYVDESNDKRSLRAHFLSHDSSWSETGNIQFAFDPILVHFLIEPKVFGLISANRSVDLKGTAAKRLYELCSLQFSKHNPVWTVAIDELRRICDVTDKHPRFDNFRRVIVEKAVADINAIAPFEVLMEVVNGGASGAATAVQFTVVSKSHARLMESKLVKSTKNGRKTRNDNVTVDFLDGRTDKERGGPADLTSAAIAKGAQIIPEGDDIDVYLRNWRDQSRGLNMIDPDTHFINFIEMQLMKKADPVLDILDDEIFYSILNGGEN